MAKVILHIGTHKTATTTIQDMFAANAKLLARHGVIYPKLGKATGHHGLAMDWNRWLPKIYEAGGSIAALEKLARDYGQTESTVFLSSEELSRGAASERVDFTAIRQALRGFAEVEVICVLREQAQYLQSIYLEVSKKRAPPRPPLVLASMLREDMVEGLWTDYNLLYDHLLTAFAPEEITFLDFDETRRAEGGILGAMLARLAPNLDLSELKLVNDGRSNTSPPPLPAWAANIVAEPHVAPDWLIQAMSGALQAQFGEGRRSLLWTRDEVATLQSYALEHNSRLAARRAAIQPGFQIAAAAPRSDAIHREDMTAEFWVRANRWTFASKRAG